MPDASIGLRTFASLPWYDFAELHAANDALWAALAGELRASGTSDVPVTLDRRSAHTCDQGAACLFTQTCGYPLLTTARDRFTTLAAPCYRAPGCTGSWHRSFIITHAAGPRETAALRSMTFAVNEADSNSGMNLARRLFAPLARDGRFFGRTILSGSHAASIALVAAGRADAAAIDCVTFALLARYRPDALRDVRVIAQTPASPAPPLVTSCHTDPATVAALRAALATVFRAERYAPVREPLLLADIEPCETGHYDIVLAYQREAAELGYPELR